MQPFVASAKLRPFLTDPHKPLIHRDLSWLQFNGRVLAEARTRSNPLLERAKFLSISASNLDEFFMIRVASLARAISSHRMGQEQRQLQRLKRIRSVILASVGRSIKRQEATLDDLIEALKLEGITLCASLSHGTQEMEVSKAVFDSRVLPELNPPEPFDPSRLPQLDNLQMAAVFSSGLWLQIPKKIKLAFGCESGHLFFLDQLLIAHLGAAFGIAGHCTILRLTRDTDLTVDLEEEDSESIPDVVRTNLSKRDKGRPIRLQLIGTPNDDLVSKSLSALKLRPQQTFTAHRTICLSGLWSALGSLSQETITRPKLVYKNLAPVIPPPFQKSGQIFEALKERDYLLHHPYDSFDAYVNWIRTACEDPQVTSIEQTVYRVDALSNAIDALKHAAMRGKRVRVVIELRARFDEMNNLRLADDLRKAGVEVAFGFGTLKVHAKVALVTRLENGVERLYTHLSTGNYNAVTARQYTDLAILTSNQALGEDARLFFDVVSKGEVPQHFKLLVSAPTKLHRRILQLIDAEVAAARNGQKARIITKVNALVDEGVIDSLYRASQAGVQVDLLVRGACSLVPGIKGLSENIRVFSIVDRFLEHSRIYYFENTKALYLSSADWMPRNFFSRLELAFPVLDARLFAYIQNVLLPMYLLDNKRSRVLTSDGGWKKKRRSSITPITRAQFCFEDLAVDLYRGTPLE